MVEWVVDGKIDSVFDFFFDFLSFEGICCSAGHFDAPVGIRLIKED